ncbi:hypothetical protein VP01_1376g1 [Puccinia sorghi]|uniref:Uncharacterized protein n=1 Tax=Puccinia sorghi TaxID=27349 RepID=A0A0L6VLQ4_9BASI|nr:hypothetical protein VP01_1376g1 [Puccinia sorghi]
MDIKLSGPAPVHLSHLADSLQPHLKMIDPSLEESKAKTSINNAGPSISNAPSTISQKNTKRKSSAKDRSSIQSSQCCQNIWHIQLTTSTNRQGAKYKLTTDVMTLVMFILEETPSTTLKKLVEHVKNKFDIHVSPSAIQKTLKNIKVTWKTVTPITHKWNEAAVLQEQHNYVLNQVTNIGKAANLKTNAGGSLINLISAIWKKENGDDPKKINIKFLPKCSLFLNPIKLAFNIIKTQIKHRAIKSQSEMAQGIRQAISNKMTPEICSKSFQNCQKFYSSCTHMQPIMGNVIKDTENFFQVPSENVS